VGTEEEEIEKDEGGLHLLDNQENETEEGREKRLHHRKLEKEVETEIGDAEKEGNATIEVKGGKEMKEKKEETKDEIKVIEMIIKREEKDENELEMKKDESEIELEMTEEMKEQKGNREKKRKKSKAVAKQ